MLPPHPANPVKSLNPTPTPANSRGSRSPAAHSGLLNIIRALGILRPHFELDVLFIEGVGDILEEDQTEDDAPLPILYNKHARPANHKP